MPRSVNDAPITTKAARDRLAPRHKAYWRSIDTGAAVGYRKGAMGGVWLVRVKDLTAAGHYRQAQIGQPDDTLKADGIKVLDFRQAENKAREWVARHHRVAAGLEAAPVVAPTKPYTVADAARDYLEDYVARGGKSLDETRKSITVHILPALGEIPLPKLTRDKVRSWHRALAASPARMRGKTGQIRYREPSNDPEAFRRRKSTANRVLTNLKAILNHARAEGKYVGSDDAWATVKAFREADSAKIRYLDDDEITRFVNACASDFRDLVTGALMTGCRYGELTRLRVGDFDPRAGTIRIGQSKGEKPRQIWLTEEGRTFFASLAAGKSGHDTLLFERNCLDKQATRTSPAVTKRVQWAKNDQSRPMKDAYKAAGISPAISFHELRHTYAARLAMRGVAMGVIARQLGHADTRMTEKHYAHLSPDYVAESVRKSFGVLGILPEQNNAPAEHARGE